MHSGKSLLMMKKKGKNTLIVPESKFVLARKERNSMDVDKPKPRTNSSEDSKKE